MSDGKILVVDDDPATLAVVGRILKRAGFDADTVPDGAAAQGMLEAHPYDLAVIDLLMPEVDGFQVLEWMREQCPDVVPFVLSGTTSLDDVVRAMRRGAYDFIAKPVIEQEVFLEQVRRALEHKRLRDSHNALMRELQVKNVELENRLGQLELAHSMLQSHALAMQADLNRARAIQRGLLPHTLPFHDAVSLAVYYQPAHKVGGDLFDVFAVDDRHLGFYVADTAGHGISSALVTVYLKHAVRGLQSEAEQGRSLLAEPGPLLRRMNTLLFEQTFGNELFISMTYAVLDTKTYALRYANAGQPPVLLRRENGAIEELRVPAPALGINPNVKYGTGEAHLNPDEMLLVHTDGVTDVRSPNGEFYGRDRLRILFSETAPEPGETVEAVQRDLHACSGEVPFEDDTTVLALGAVGQDSPGIPLIPPVRPHQDRVETAGAGVRSARENRQTFVEIHGSGTWRESQQVLELLERAREANDNLFLLDFRHCNHLDSTFLGVLHTICAESEEQKPLVQLQHLPKPLMKEISELGLTSVLFHFRSKTKPVPHEMEEMRGQSISGESMGRLLLQAHEALVEADPSNADRFAAVLELLHRQQAPARRHGNPDAPEPVE